MYYLFGYGSLINKRSVAKTLQKPIGKIEIRPAILLGYQRVWNLVECNSLEDGTHIEGVFLNIEPDPDTACWGVIIKVSEEELLQFDQRERRYDRIDVTHLMEQEPDLPTITYTGKEAYLHPGDKAVVFARYEKLIEVGLQDWGSQVTSFYHQSTKPHTFNIIDGSYTFASI